MSVQENHSEFPVNMAGLQVIFLLLWLKQSFGQTHVHLDKNICYLYHLFGYIVQSLLHAWHTPNVAPYQLTHCTFN